MLLLSCFHGDSKIDKTTAKHAKKQLLVKAN